MPSIIDTPISLADAAKLIDKSQRWVNLLVANGYIKKTPNNKYTPREVAIGALRAAADDKKTTAHSSAVADLAATKARIAKMKEAQMRGELVNEAALLERVAGQLAKLGARLAAIPATFTRNLEERRRLEKLINEVRNDFARELQAHAGED